MLQQSLVRCKTCYKVLGGTLLSQYQARLQDIGKEDRLQEDENNREAILNDLGVYRRCCRVNITQHPVLPLGIVVDGYNDPVIEQMFRDAGLASEKTTLALTKFKEEATKVWSNPNLEISNTEANALKQVYQTYASFPSVEGKEGKEPKGHPSVTPTEGWEFHLALLKSRVKGNFNPALLPISQMEMHYHLYRYVTKLKNDLIIFNICRELKVPGGAREIPIRVSAIADAGYLAPSYLQTKDKTFTNMKEVRPAVPISELPLQLGKDITLSADEVRAFLA